MSVLSHDAFFDHVLEIFLSEKCAVLLNCQKKIACLSSFFYLIISISEDNTPGFNCKEVSADVFLPSIMAA